MRNFKLYLWVGVLIFSGACGSQEFHDSSLAGGVEDGNGGDVLVCDEVGDHEEKVQSLDWYLTSLSGQPKLSDATKDPTQLQLWLVAEAQRVVMRLAAYDPYRAGLYSSYIKNFFADAYIKENLYIPELGDEGPIPMPGPSCRVINAVYQTSPKLSWDHRYSIKKELWDQMSPQSKVAMIVHEVIYRETRQYYNNARLAIEFNIQLLSDRVSTMSRSEYITLITKTLKLPPVYQTPQGLWLDLTSVKFLDGPWGRYAASGKLTTAKLFGQNDEPIAKWDSHFKDAILMPPAVPFRLVTLLDNDRGMRSHFEFYSDGMVHNIQGQLNAWGGWEEIPSGECHIDFQTLVTYPIKAISLYPSGQLETIHADTMYGQFVVNCNGTIYMKDALEYQPDGTLKL